MISQISPSSDSSALLDFPSEEAPSETALEGRNLEIIYRLAAGSTVLTCLHFVIFSFMD